MTRWIRFPVSSFFINTLGKTHPNPVGVIGFHFRFLHGEKGKSFMGFTLLELIVVTAILGALASIALPAYWNYLEKARVTRAIADIRQLERLISAFQAANVQLPDSLDEIGMGNTQDPWGNPYQYLNITSEGGVGRARKDHHMVPLNEDFDLYSMGKDGESRSPLTAAASHDDVIRAYNGQYVGPVSEF